MIQNLIRAAIAASMLVCAAQAQVTGGMFCVPNAGNPPMVRAEGTTELTGDLLLVCTGGTPTPRGQPIPLVTINLLFGIEVTNRMLGSLYSDALLLIDEPYPASPLTSTSTPTAPANSPAQALCYSNTDTPSPGSCNYLLGTGGGGYGTSTSPYLQSGASTIYAGLTPTTGITWRGVPIDPPGTNGAQRIIRLSGIRAATDSIGSHFFPVGTYLEVGYSHGSDQVISLVNPAQTIAYNEPGLLTAPTFVPLCGCTSHNAPLLSGTGPASFDGNVRLREGFAYAFRRRSLGLTEDGPTAPNVYATNVPGAPDYTETGFLPSPIAISLPSYTLSPADFGTRIMLWFNVQPGVHVFVPVSVPLTGGHPQEPVSPVPSGISDSQLQLVETDETGSSAAGYTSPPSTAMIGSIPVAEATRNGDLVYATYEVVNSDPTAIEAANIPVAIAFTNLSAQNGNAPVTITLAPFAALPAGFYSGPIPRFGAASRTPANGDFDLNGISDRVWQNDATGAATVHYYGPLNGDFGSGSVVYQSWNLLNTTNVAGWHIVAVADFNGDGYPDLVWQNDTTRQVVVHYYGGTGGAVFQSWNWLQSTPVPAWHVVGAADFNGDGFPDLVWQSDTTREVTVHYYRGPGGAVYQGWNSLYNQPVPGWHVAAVADFNGDGYPDLVWQNDTTGQVTVHYYGWSGVPVFQSWSWLNKTGEPSGWNIKAAVDVNGDGVPDLIWQDEATRKVTVHYYGGTGGATLMGWGWINETGVPGWSIIH